MPRGVKGSGKAKETVAKRPYHRKDKAVDAPVAAAPKSTLDEMIVDSGAGTASIADAATKARKPYPTADERVAMADQQIERLTKLNAARTALVEKTAGLLAERQDALAEKAKPEEKDHYILLRDSISRRLIFLFGLHQHSVYKKSPRCVYRNCNVHNDASVAGRVVLPPVCH